jgi:hypothetical protein
MGSHYTLASHLRKYNLLWSMSSTSSSILLPVARRKQQNFPTDKQSYCAVVQWPTSSPATKAAPVNPPHLFVNTTGRIDKRQKPTTSGASHSAHRPFFSQLTPQNMFGEPTEVSSIGSRDAHCSATSKSSQPRW